jgi:Methylamine utilisation protein MauE
MIDPVVAWLARLALAGVFAAAALHKWRDLGAFTAAVAAHRLVPEASAGALARALAVTETAVAVGLLVPASAPRAAWIAAALLALYTGAIAINLARGRREIDCGCSARPQPLSGGLLARNAALAAAALPAALPTGARALVWIDALTAIAALAALALLWLAAQTLAFGATARIGRSA